MATSAKIEIEFNRARRELIDFSALVKTSEAAITQLQVAISESLANIPLDKLDAAALRQTETRLKLEAENLKLTELEKRQQTAQSKVVSLNAEFREAKGRELATAAYVESDKLMTKLEELLPQLEEHSNRYEEINQYFRGYNQPFSASLVNSIRHNLEVYKSEARQRAVM